MGLAGLAAIKKDFELRKRNANTLVQGLTPFKGALQLPFIPKGAEHAFMMFPIVVTDKKIDAEELVNWLENYNVETRPLFPLLNQPVYKKIFGNLEPRYPVAAFTRKNGFYIGCHPQLKMADINYIISVFKEFFKTKELFVKHG